MKSMRVRLLVAVVAIISSGRAGADVTVSSNPALVGQGVVFTVQLNPPSGVIAIPTGSVTFVDGGAGIGTVPLQNGVATLAAEFTTVGDHSIVAEYSGDSNFQPANSPPFIEHITADDVLTLAVSPTVLKQPPGGSSTARVTLFGNGSVSASVHLSCENLPPGTSCSFQVNTLKPSSAGSSTTMTITSTATRTATTSASYGSAYHAALFLPFLFGSIFTRSVFRWGKKARLLAGLCVLGTVTMCLTGCGDTLRVIRGGTPTGSYTIRVVGNDGTLTQTANIQLTLN